MTLLFDENISYRIVKKIKEEFPECLHVSKIRPVLRDDFSIFNPAKQNNMVIVTFDEDFRDLQVVYDSPPKILVENGEYINVEHHA